MKQTVKRRAGEPAVRRASQLTVRSISLYKDLYAEIIIRCSEIRLQLEVDGHHCQTAERVPAWRNTSATTRHAPKATATAIALDSRHRKRAPSQLDAEQMLLQMFCGEPPRGE